MAVHRGHQIQQSAQYGFMQTTHSTSFLSLRASEKGHIPIVPYWSYDHIGLEILGEYLLATAYDAETVRDRIVRSPSFH